MSRSKKSRSGGNTDVVIVRNRTQSDVEGRLRKKEKKRKGLKTGNRNSDGNEPSTNSVGKARDPRLGSKKKIPLVVKNKTKPTKAQRKLSAEQELEMLENDAQLNVLLDRLDNGESLGAGLQKYVDQKLTRIEALMKQLGIFDVQMEDAEEQETRTAKSSKNVDKDDALLSQFEDVDLNQFKG